MKKPRLTQSANKRKKSLIPTPNLLNKSDPNVLLSESYAAYFPKKCNKKLPKSPSKPNIFEKLSDEVIVKIFSYFNQTNLSRVSMVCHRFRRIGDHSSEIRVLRSTKSSSKTLQNLLYFMYMKSENPCICSFFRFSFQATLLFPL